MRIVADTDVCIGAGQCALRAPAYFDQSEEDGTVVVLASRPEPADEEDVRAAVDLCPSGALSVVEEQEATAADGR